RIAMRIVLAVLLALEALNSLAWLARIASFVAAYDATVLSVAALRAVVTAVQLMTASLLVRQAPPALTFARAVFVLSALLLVVELGLGLAPSSVPSWWRWQVVSAYAVYAAAAVAVISWMMRRPRSSTS